MQNAIAFANNDIATVAWSYGRPLTGCMGFAVYRIDEAGTETALPAMATFPGMTRKPGQTCEVAPFQKFYWKDPYARLVAEKTGKAKFRYKVVPLTGKPGQLVPMHIPFVISNEIEISPQMGEGFQAYFNRGLLSTQRVYRAFKGKPAKGKLLPQIQQQGNPLRASLSGDMVGALTDFVGRTKKGGEIYAALYELTDQQLIDTLKGLKKKLHLVLSNAMQTDAKTKKKFDENMPARGALQKTAGEEINRILPPSNQIGHNKFLVYVDNKKKPQAVLFGSTNWTATGLCAQTNNTIVLEDPIVAGNYLAYWNNLAADTKKANGVAKNLQGAGLRSADAKSLKPVKLEDGDGELTSWYSPNTPKLRSSKKKPGTKETTPPDMKQVIDLVNGARQAVLFLVFYPGTPSIANWAAAAQKKNKDLFVRGCVTNPSASEGFYYELHGVTPPKKVKGQKGPKGKQDARVIAAKALDDTHAPQGWSKELLNAGFAIIHDKIVVVDPFSDNCAVVTGSHNLGYKASYNNDENLAIIRGNKKLAAAYASHVLDVYDHFSWRVQMDSGKAHPDQSLETDPAKWQGRYFDDNGKIKVAQLKFWLSALA